MVFFTLNQPNLTLPNLLQTGMQLPAGLNISGFCNPFLMHRKGTYKYVFCCNIYILNAYSSGECIERHVFYLEVHIFCKNCAQNVYTGTKQEGKAHKGMEWDRTEL